MPIRSTVKLTKSFFRPFFRPQRALYSTASSNIPRLEVLDKMVQSAKNQPLPNLDKTAFVGVQHLLETTATLFQSLIYLGVQPQNMFFSGKCYSTSPSVAKTIEGMGINILPGSKPERIGGYQAASKQDVITLWKQFEEVSQKREIDRVIILDDGGRCIEEMPNSIPFDYFSASIEQTRGGLYSNSLDRLVLPLIEVASSAVKKQIESPLIAETILLRVKKLLSGLNLNKQSVCGVVGNGSIGNAVARYLLSLGHHVIVYDENPTSFKEFADKKCKLHKMPNIETLISYSSFVFGCTGKDITKDIDIFDIVKNEITLISCTSEDKEFASLLEQISKEGKRFYFNPLSDITCLSNKGNKISILRGGFPINFNSSPFSVRSKDIEITRALLLGACIQAISVSNKPIDDNFVNNQQKRHMLDPYLQQFALKEWLKYQPKQRYNQELLNKFNDIEWIKTQSGGIYYPHPIINDAFTTETEKTQNRITYLAPS